MGRLLGLVRSGSGDRVSRVNRESLALIVRILEALEDPRTAPELAAELGLRWPANLHRILKELESVGWVENGGRRLQANGHHARVWRRRVQVVG